MSKQIEQIITEVQRRLDASKKVLPELRCPENISYYKGCIEAYEWVISFLKLIPEEPSSEYSFNIPSELYHQLTPEQQKEWRKDVEQAYNAGAGNKEESENNDLEAEIQRYYVDWDEHPEYVQTARHFARWQEQQDEKDTSDMLFVEYLRGADEGKRMMTEKACNYLKDHIDEGLVIYHNDTWQKRDEFIKKFCNAMAE